jgi:plastocyanin
MSLASAGERAQPRRHTVVIDATSYTPKTLTVSAGDTVEWVNRDLVTHTATGKGGSFDSGDIPAGKSWAFTVKADGLFGYTCTYHPTMKGTLRVR